jgi:hypothetical protein
MVCKSFTPFADNKQSRGRRWRFSNVFQHFLHDSSARNPATSGEPVNQAAAKALPVLFVALLVVSCAHVQPPAKNVSSASSRWTNSLGMIFVRVLDTKVSFSIYETRVKDFTAFAVANPKLAGTNWNHSFYHVITPVWPGPDFPVVNVSWNDASAFCAWLTETERAAGEISAKEFYRLPTDEEWSRAVGIGGRETGATPKEKSAKLENVYP